MRKLLWCCSAAGILTAGGLFSTAYLACRYPDSTVGRCVNTVANSSILLQPVTGLATVMAKATHQAINPHETACTPGSAEECVPDDPRRIEHEPVETRILELSGMEVEMEAAPIVINEDDPTPRVNEVESLPSPLEVAGGQEEQGDNACPMFMPYCTDDGESMVEPTMPDAEGQNKTQADGSAKSDDNAYKAWVQLLEEAEKKKSAPAEELPAPREEAQSEPKCEEDSHLHEHYSGCPHTTCPYTGKSYPSSSYEPSMKSGQEEISEEPPTPPTQPKKVRKGKDKSPRPAGVDTMEYRHSDGGLNEYGNGPL